MVLLQTIPTEKGRLELWLISPFRVMWVEVRNKRTFIKGSNTSHFYQAYSCASRFVEMFTLIFFLILEFSS